MICHHIWWKRQYAKVGFTGALLRGVKNYPKIREKYMRLPLFGDEVLPTDLAYQLKKGE
jgi:hypothetical protein